MSTWLGARWTIDALVDIMENRRRILYKRAQIEDVKAGRSTCIYVSLQPLEGFDVALIHRPDLLALISNQLVKDRRLIYHKVPDNHSVFTIHPVDWIQEEGMLFPLPHTGYAFSEAVIVHQIVDIFNDMCRRKYPALGDRAAYEVFIGMATGPYQWPETGSGRSAPLYERTNIHILARDISRETIPGYTNSLSDVQRNGVFMDPDTYNWLDPDDFDQCEWVRPTLDRIHTNCSYMIYEDFKNIYYEYGSTGIEAVMAYERRNNREIGRSQ